MHMFCIVDRQREGLWGPYTDQALAEKILRIVQMGTDEGAEIVSLETNEWVEEISAGLLPWKIIVILDSGRIVETSCALTWPPEQQEGIIRGKEIGLREERVEYFAWAKTSQAAKLKLARLGSTAPKAIADEA